MNCLTLLASAATHHNLSWAMIAIVFIFVIVLVFILVNRL